MLNCIRMTHWKIIFCIILPFLLTTFGLSEYITKEYYYTISNKADVSITENIKKLTPAMECFTDLSKNLAPIFALNNDLIECLQKYLEINETLLKHIEQCEKKINYYSTECSNIFSNYIITNQTVFNSFIMQFYTRDKIIGIVNDHLSSYITLNKVKLNSHTYSILAKSIENYINTIRSASMFNIMYGHQIQNPNYSNVLGVCYSENKFIKINTELLPYNQRNILTYNQRNISKFE